MKKMYAIHDKKAQRYLPPMVLNTHGEAERTLENAVRDKESMIAQHPGDFELCYIADYDERTGSVTAVNHRVILNADALFLKRDDGVLDIAPNMSQAIEQKESN